jgi:hypothetical protein
MNLKRLLTVGGSLESRKAASGRYRMAAPGVLPKFELRGDTITAIPMEGVVPASRRVVKDSPGPLFDTLHPAEAPAPRLSEPRLAEVEKRPEAPVAPQVANPFATAVAGRPVRLGFFRTLFGAVGGLLADAFSGRRNRVRSRAGREAVQGELGLEAVKPLRNDLSGSDFEMVAVPVANRAPGLVVRGPVPAPLPAAQSPVPAAVPVPAVPVRKDGQLIETGE